MINIYAEYCSKCGGILNCPSTCNNSDHIHCSCADEGQKKVWQEYRAKVGVDHPEALTSREVVDKLDF